MRFHQPTIDYVTRRTAEGLAKRDLIRCLKRFLARWRPIESSLRPDPVIDPEQADVELDVLFAPYGCDTGRAMQQRQACGRDARLNAFWSRRMRRRELSESRRTPRAPFDSSLAAVFGRSDELMT